MVSCAMSARSGDKQRVAQSSLKPSFVEDNNGWYISVVCGSLTGQLYVNKLDVSKKALSNASWLKGAGTLHLSLRHLVGRKQKLHPHLL